MLGAAPPFPLGSHVAPTPPVWLGLLLLRLQDLVCGPACHSLAPGPLGHTQPQDFLLRGAGLSLSCGDSCLKRTPTQREAGPRARKADSWPPRLRACLFPAVPVAAAAVLAHSYPGQCPTIRNQGSHLATPVTLGPEDGVH